MTNEEDPLLTCPAWCSGDHSGQEPELVDRFHDSRPVALDVRTGLVDVEFETVISQYPFASKPEKRAVYAWCHMSASVTMNRPPDVVAFADMLTGYVRRLREVAEELVIAQQQNQVRVEADLKDAGREA